MFEQTLQADVVPFRKVPDGVFLVKKPSTKFPGAEHYGVLVAGEPLRSFGIPGYEPVIIHRTLDMRTDWAETTGVWEMVSQVPPDQTQSAVARASIEFNEANYYLLTNNCEHTARFITSGEKRSTQVAVLVGIGVAAAAVTWLNNRKVN